MAVAARTGQDTDKKYLVFRRITIAFIILLHVIHINPTSVRCQVLRDNAMKDGTTVLTIAHRLETILDFDR